MLARHTARSGGMSKILQGATREVIYDYAERAFVTILGASIILRFLPTLASHPFNAVLLASECAAVAMILLRKRAQRMDISAYAVTIALVGTTAGLLVQPGENSQSARQMRFTSASEITKLRTAIRSYVKEAVELEKSGAKVDFKKSEDLVYPKEFQDKLDRNSALREAFFALTPGRQRQYHLHFTGAKQAATRESRVEKAIPLILDGMGLNDR